MIFYPSPTKLLKRNQGVLDLHRMWRMKKGKHLTIPVITVSQQGTSTNQLSVMEIQ